jgi:hypothetical protein
VYNWADSDPNDPNPGAPGAGSLVFRYDGAGNITRVVDWNHEANASCVRGRPGGQKNDREK